MLRKPYGLALAAWVLAAHRPVAADALSEAAAPVTLRQCYAWAIARSEDLKVRQEDILQSRAQARAALGSAFPYLGWEITDTWQDPKGVDQLGQ